VKLSENNLLLLSDSYKFSHFVQYPLRTTQVYSYLESRGGKWDKTLFFGLQILLKKHLEGPVVTKEFIDEAEEFANAHFGGTGVKFNRKGWEHILEKHNGYLPLLIKAVPEGTVLPNKNVLITVENTDPACWWLTNFVETLLVQAWYPITVATQSYYMKGIIRRYLDETGGDLNGLSFKLHDFGFRGVSSVESAGIGGAAHLVNFMGTDTVAGIVYANKYYNSGVCGHSIPASEHSTITSWGENGELDAMKNMLEQYPSGLVACVSDSFDIFRACSKYWGEILKDKVLDRDGVLVIRPDSGIPEQIVPQVLGLLGDKFGYTTNEKGFKLLNPKVRVIQGDGVDYAGLQDILEAIRDAGWSTDNVAFGSGGGLLQKLNRDTLKFAFKCSDIVIDGEHREVFKQPITDPGKQSKKGRLKLIRPVETGVYTTVAEAYEGKDELVTVFENGKLVREYSFEEVRTNANN
jgi:nicotinamide phosphoribosyltransferase